MRKVVCAANKLPDGTLILGARHFDERMQEMYELVNAWTKFEPGSEVQGFIDQYGKFMDRIEAKQVAVAAGQVVQFAYGQFAFAELFSEDLY